MAENRVADTHSFDTTTSLAARLRTVLIYSPWLARHGSNVQTRSPKLRGFTCLPTSHWLLGHDSDVRLSVQGRASLPLDYQALCCGQVGFKCNGFAPRSAHRLRRLYLLSHPPLANQYSCRWFSLLTRLCSWAGSGARPRLSPWCIGRWLKPVGLTHCSRSYQPMNILKVLW